METLIIFLLGALSVFIYNIIKSKTFIKLGVVYDYARSVGFEENINDYENKLDFLVLLRDFCKKNKITQKTIDDAYKEKLGLSDEEMIASFKLSLRTSKK